MISLISSSPMTEMPSHRALLPDSAFSYDMPSELPSFALDSSFGFNAIPEFRGFWFSSFDSFSLAEWSDEEEEFEEDEEFDDEEFDDEDDLFDDDEFDEDDLFDDDEFEDEDFEDEDFEDEDEEFEEDFEED